MAIEAVKIPQNVYVEDRIIGPVSLRQIIICMIGAAISWVLWSSVNAIAGASIILLGLTWLPAVIAAAFAFVSINGISLFRMLLLTLERMDKPNTRVWHPRQGILINVIVSGPQKVSDEQRKQEQERQTRIDELSSMLDKGRIDKQSSMDADQEESNINDEPVLTIREVQKTPQEPVIAEALERPIDDVRAMTPASTEQSERPVPDTPVFRDLLPPSTDA